jgi:hypothetical protein
MSPGLHLKPVLQNTKQESRQLVRDVRKSIAVFNLLQTVPTRREEGGNRYILPEPGGPKGVPGPDCVAYVFVLLGSIIICGLHKLTVSDQAQVTLQLTVSLYDLV